VLTIAKTASLKASRRVVEAIRGGAGFSFEWLSEGIYITGSRTASIPSLGYPPVMTR